MLTIEKNILAALLRIAACMMSGLCLYSTLLAGEPVKTAEQPPALSAQNILGMMHQRIARIEAHDFRLKVEERWQGNHIHRGEVKVSAQLRPLQIRVELLKPEEGPLVEYPAENNPRLATVIPKKWLPALKFGRDIHGETLRKGHYAINETTFAFFDGLIRRMEQQFRMQGRYQESVRYLGTVQVAGKTCHRVEMIDAQYRLLPYEIQPGDDLIRLGKRLLLSPYKIRELNPQLSSYFDLKPGQILTLPSSYSRRTILLIDAQKMVPRVLEVYDEKGRFERYCFEDIVIKQ
ncbi:MAG: LysM peptidoglycan-binding domain-containing protein [Bacteroidota bacterium]